VRHIDLIESGKGNEIVQETRGFEENKRVTLSQRKKENADDYKYFPDPDLPKLYLHSIFNLDDIKNSLPENIDVTRNKLKELNIQENYIEILISNSKLFNYFKEIQNELEKYHDFKNDNNNEKYKKLITLSINYICVDVVSILQKESKEIFVHFIDAENFVEIIQMISENELGSRGAKDLINIMMTEIPNDNMMEMSENNYSARVIANEKGLIQKNDLESLNKIVEEVKLANEKE
jgi:aspartyl-tRNA(Asn)/glutamyl-tRNA(Gln) amidotransferase subunit B